MNEICRCQEPRPRMAGDGKIWCVKCGHRPSVGAMAPEEEEVLPQSPDGRTHTGVHIPMADGAEVSDPSACFDPCSPEQEECPPKPDGPHVPRQQAKEIARQLTKRPCTLSSISNPKVPGGFLRTITVVEPDGGSVHFDAPSWWLALRLLESHLRIREVLLKRGFEVMEQMAAEHAAKEKASTNSDSVP